MTDTATPETISPPEQTPGPPRIAEPAADPAGNTGPNSTGPDITRPDSTGPAIGTTYEHDDLAAMHEKQARIEIDLLAQEEALRKAALADKD